MELIELVKQIKPEARFIPITKKDKFPIPIKITKIDKINKIIYTRLIKGK